MKSVFLIRHGESTFNAIYAKTLVDPNLIDAPLSPTGEAQVVHASAQARALKVELVVSTPFTRALQTARGLFGEAHPLLVEPLHRERVTASCDIGRSPRLLAADFPDLSFDHIGDPWWHCEDVDTNGIPQEPLDIVHERVAQFRDWLRARRETRIAVVGHSAFFFHMTSHKFANCEMLETTV